MGSLSAASGAPSLAAAWAISARAADFLARRPGRLPAPVGPDPSSGTSWTVPLAPPRPLEAVPLAALAVAFAALAVPAVPVASTDPTDLAALAAALVALVATLVALVALAAFAVLAVLAVLAAALVGAPALSTAAAFFALPPVFLTVLLAFFGASSPLPATSPAPAPSAPSV